MKVVLHCRQLALKVCANALFGFTGASSSPLACAPLAEGCIMRGAQLCAAAKKEIEARFPDARVVYGQTDSLFVTLEGYSVARAVETGQAIAKTVTAALAAPPVALAFERVMHPFLLLEVNR